MNESWSTEHYITIQRARFIFPHVGHGSVCTCMCAPGSVCLPAKKWPDPVSYPGQANRFWTLVGWLSSLWKAAWCEGCMWGTGRGKGTHSLSIFNKQLEIQPNARKNSDLSRRNDTAWFPGFLWGTVRQGFFWHSNLKWNQSTNSGGSSTLSGTL